MRCLLDTHTLLWFIAGDNKLSANANKLITDANTEIFISAASLFEMAVKINIGKLQLSTSLLSYVELIRSNGIDILPLSEAGLHQYSLLPLHAEHRDPFDRMLIATAISESLTVISADRKFDHYSKMIAIVW